MTNVIFDPIAASSSIIVLHARSAPKGAPHAYNLIQNSGETVAGLVQNLKPWPKGVSGNPGGRPRKKLITSELERLLQEQSPDTSGKTWAVLIAEALLRQAAKGDVRAIGELANRVEGKPLQGVHLDVNQSSPMWDATDEELEQRIAELWEQLLQEKNASCGQSKS